MRRGLPRGAHAPAGRDRGQGAPPSLVRRKRGATRFRQEAEITSTLRHPHIVQVFDFDVAASGVHYLVMELLGGAAHADRRSGRARAAAAVEHRRADRAGPSRGPRARIVIATSSPKTSCCCRAAAEDFVKVLDFGISQASWRPQLGESDHVAGTPQYMAPEQAQGLRDQIDHRRDQFSFAAIAYTMFTGREPFRGGRYGRGPLPGRAHRASPTLGAGAVPAPRDRRGDHARPVKESADRYPNMLAFAAALRSAMEGVVTVTASDDGKTPAQRRRLSASPPTSRRRRCRCRCRCRCSPGL